MKSINFKAALLVGFVLFGAVTGGMAQPTNARETESPAQRDERMQWWREAKFGMFIHWGLYSVPAGVWKGEPVGFIGEWIMHTARIPVADYATLAGQFNPQKYDPDAWVRLAKAAGMKYIIITTKHHDGFAMFQTAASPFNICDASPFKRDPLKELAEACQRHGMKLGFYYSQAQDWHHRGGAASGGHWDPAAQDGDMTEYIKTIAVPQVKELLTNYGPVSVFWWDSAVDMTQERADLLAPLLKLQPGVISNDRLGAGHHGDTVTPEQRIPATGFDRDWESCMTMNDTWGYKSTDHKWKSPEALLRNLVEVVSKGGNYLLNVGPTAEGEIPSPSVDSLEKIGGWIDRNGDSIYGTTASPFPELHWGVATRKGQRLYLHVLDWPQDNLLIVPMTGTAEKAYLLGASGKLLPFSQPGGGLRVRLPQKPEGFGHLVVVLDGVSDVGALPKSPVHQNASGEAYLDCDEAERTGAELKVHGYSKHELDLSGWKLSTDEARWHLLLEGPQTFEVIVTVNVPERGAGGTYQIRLGDQELVYKTRATEGKAFEAVSAGRLRVERGGRYDLTVRPDKISGVDPLKLRAVTLRPVE